MAMTTTEWREYTDGGFKFRTRIKYGFDVVFAERLSQLPYFSLTHDTERRVGRRWVDDSCGAGLPPQFSELEPLLKWHLCSVERPMHYVANGLYWWEQGAASGWAVLTSEHFGANPVEGFKRTVVYGALETDRDFDVQAPSRTKSEVREWLVARLPALMAKMREEMARFGVVVPPSEGQ